MPIADKPEFGRVEQDAQAAAQPNPEVDIFGYLKAQDRRILEMECRLSAVAIATDVHIRAQCLQWAVQSFQHSPVTDRLLERAREFHAFVKGT